MPPASASPLASPPLRRLSASGGGTASRTPLSPRTPLHRPDLDHPQAHLLAAPLQRSRHGALSHTHLRHTNSHLLKAEAASHLRCANASAATAATRHAPSPPLSERAAAARQARAAGRSSSAAVSEQSRSNLGAISEQSRSNLGAAHPRPTYARPPPPSRSSSARPKPLERRCRRCRRCRTSCSAVRSACCWCSAQMRHTTGSGRREMRTRCGRDAAAMRTRCSRDVAEMRTTRCG